MNTHPLTEKEVFTFQYTFNAPKEMVFDAFSDAEALNEWWGPVESTNSVVLLDFRPGGIFLFKMESQRRIAYGRFLFKTIQPHDLLEFTNAFADEHGKVVKAPFDISLPLEIFYSFRFEEQNGKTTLFLTAWPETASEEEAAGMRSIHDGMKQGFGATFDSLSGYLGKKTLQNEN